jgi:hypothetical protein
MRPLPLLILALTLAAPSARAENVLFIGPGDSVISLQADICPAGRQCLDTGLTVSGVDGPLVAAIPDWAIQDSVPTPGEYSRPGYLRGLSDGFLIDYCDECNCCIIVSPGTFDAAALGQLLDAVP